jgi:RHS repeat-associated protein
MTFDSRYRITENKLFNPPNTVARYTYSYDAGENITAIQDMVDATYTRNFGYDDLNRLITANTGTSLWGTGSYTYDAMGNLTSRSLGTPPVDTGQPLSIGRPFHTSTTVTGQVDRLAFTFAGTTPKISIVTANGLDHTISYDAAGNETGYLANRTYSARNLMNAVADTSGEGPAHQISYGYDWRGVRVSRTETPTDAGSASRYFFYSPELQLLESTVDDSNNVWGQSGHHIASAPLATNRDIIWFNGAPVAEIGPARTPDNTPLSTHRTFATALDATNTFWTFTDHLGTPLIQMDNTTAIVWRAEHEPYGNVWKMRGGARTDQPLRFPGQELAMTWEGGEENYNVFRWYRSSFGRFDQADPIGQRGGANLYAYVAGNPTRFSDRLGQDIEIRKGTQDPNDPSWMAFHESICVDTWSGCKNGCPGKSLGKLCFTFGWNNKWKLGSPSFNWLGKFTPWVNPGTGMQGEVYITDLPPTIVNHLSTDCNQDTLFVKKLLQLLGTTDTYTCGFYNCINFAHQLFDEAQQMFTGK